MMSFCARSFPVMHGRLPSATILGLICALPASAQAPTSAPATSRPTADRLPVAVLDFGVGAGFEPSHGKVLADKVRDELQEAEGIVLVDREQVDKVQKELDFQASIGCTENYCLKRYPKRLGAKKIIGGFACQFPDGKWSLKVAVAGVSDDEYRLRTEDYDNVGQLKDAARQLACDLLGLKRKASGGTPSPPGTPSEGRAPNPPTTAAPGKPEVLDLGDGVKMELVLVRPGWFMMGSESGDDNGKPVHKVTITKPFYLGKYEVTQEQWEAVMGSNPSRFKGPKLPVENVSWDDCQKFLEALGRKVPGRKFALPTEAQWEYACRAGSSTAFCYGDAEAGLGDYAWFDRNSGDTTHDVGQKKPNAWGLYDMHGNVWEWCRDWYGAYSSGDQTNPTGAASSFARVLRGGSWIILPTFCRSAYRYRSGPDYRGGAVGFRVAAGT